MYPHQDERLTDALARAGADALVATTPANVAYVSGLQGAAAGLDRASPCFAVYARAGTGLVVPAREAPAVAARGGIDVTRVACYGRPVAGGTAADPAARRLPEWLASAARDATDALADLLDALGAGRRIVGIDEGHLTYAAWERLRERLAGATVVPAADHLAAARAVKGPWELECLQRALGIAEEAVNEVVQRLAPGMTGREAALLYRQEVLKRGATPGPVVVASGPDSAIPTASPSERDVRPGDLIRLEVACVFRGYWADVGRTAVVGSPTARQEAVALAVQAALEAAVETLRPGTTAAAAPGPAVAALQAAGLEPALGDRVGSGIGLDFVEPPVLAADVGAPLEQGMALRVEAAHYEPGWGGVSLRDTVLVGRQGAVAFNRSHRSLLLLD